jgi:lipopolysaccharide/colanic/teichoic acid biosynthesis glycosyltransferase
MVAGAVLLIGLPVFLLLALGTWISVGGPIFFGSRASAATDASSRC